MNSEAVAALSAQLINRSVNKHLGTSLSVSKIRLMKLSLLMSSMQLWKVWSAVRVCIPKKTLQRMLYEHYGD